MVGALWLRHLLADHGSVGRRGGLDYEHVDAVVRSGADPDDLDRERPAGGGDVLPERAGPVQLVQPDGAAGCAGIGWWGHTESGWKK